MSSFSRQRIRIRNEADLANVTPGLLLEIQRGSYTLCAVSIGDGKVCHFTTEVFKNNNACYASSLASVSGSSGCKGRVLVQTYREMLSGENPPVFVNNSRDGNVCHFTVEVFKDNGSSFTGSLAAMTGGKGRVLVQTFREMLGGENLPVFVNNSSDSKWT
ncbi:hypothetical protein ElyMa_006524900 [Elysia marginata]|uniref:Profilin n=1 Tax=Elysia marginata TaxID=1093978 RepID=A0AAV4I6E4_9GAST|nr:hypothetical protein ElyMa_006524900 [Elysia marginata]